MKSGLAPRMIPMAPWVVFSLGVMVTLGLWFGSQRIEEEKQRLAFEGQVLKLTSGIQARLRAHEQILRGVTGLFAASNDVDRQEFKSYISSLQVANLYPGIQGIGFARYLAASDVLAHEQQIRAEGFPAYQIIPPGNREVYSAIVYLEPFDWRNQRAFGFDMFSEPVRQQAMARARDTGEASLSGKVTLLQETDKDVQAGVLFYVPVYRGDANTLEERRQNLYGWAYSPLRMRDLLDSVLRHDFPEFDNRIGVAIYDADIETEANLLYQSHPTNPPGKLRKINFIEDGGRTWRVMTYALPGFSRQGYVSPQIGLVLAGLAISALLASIVALVAKHHREQGKTLADLARTHHQLEESQRELRTIYDASSVAIFSLNNKGIITNANAHMASMFRVPTAELIGSQYESWLTVEDRNEVPRSLNERFTESTATSNLGHIRHYQRPDGTVFIGRISACPVLDSGENPQGIVAVIADVTAEHQQEAERRIAAVAFESMEAMVVTDTNGSVIRCNAAFSELTGYEQDEILGRNLRLLRSGRHDSNFYAEMWREISQKGFWQGEIWNRRKDGEIFPQWETITAVKNAEGLTTHYIGSGFDISQRVALDAEMRNLAFYDPLTGLANRRLLTDRLNHAFAKSSRTKQHGALIYLDLDHFKALNDHLGHAEGDHLLELVADRLRNHVREGDTVARLGGDEFVILLEDLGKEITAASALAMEVAEKLRTSLNNPYMLHGKMPDDWHCTPSIGVTLFIDHAESIDVLLDRADKALYEAKQGGRNRICLDDKFQSLEE